LRNNVINCIVDWLHAHRFGFEFIEHIRWTRRDQFYKQKIKNTLK
jgi:hypothetical protein